MSEYLVKMPTVGVRTFRVEANSKEEARAKMREGGHALIVDETTHVIEDEDQWEITRERRPR